MNDVPCFLSYTDPSFMGIITGCELCLFNDTTLYDYFYINTLIISHVVYSHFIYKNIITGTFTK